MYICVILKADGRFIRFMYTLFHLNQTYINKMCTQEMDTKFSTGTLKGRESGDVGLDNTTMQK